MITVDSYLIVVVVAKCLSIVIIIVHISTCTTCSTGTLAKWLLREGHSKPHCVLCSTSYNLPMCIACQS